MNIMGMREVKEQDSKNERERIECADWVLLVLRHESVCLL